MSLQSGIRADEYAASELSAAKQSDARALKLLINDESLKLVDSAPIISNWEEDYDKSVLPMLDDITPCYVFYRLDSTSQFGRDWIFIYWVPECASARDKMLYASTRAKMRKQFGDNLIKEDITASVVSDINLHGLKKYLLSKSAPAPLTAAEREKAEVYSDKVNSGFYGARQTVGSIMFKLTDTATACIRSFAEEEIDYLQLAIDPELEQIIVSHISPRMHPDTFVKITPPNDGRYHLFRFHYQLDDQQFSPLFFIHSISGYKSTVKSRMLYSSCKSAFIAQLEKEFGLQFDHRLETDGMNEITSAYLMDILHPTPPESKPKFERPRGPTGRRPRTQL